MRSRAPSTGSGRYGTGGVLGVIPARLGSSRLPRKPLRVIAGRPLIEWVWRRAERSAALDALVVATDAREVLEVVEGFGGVAVLTRPDHASGTDRVAETAEREEYRELDPIVNVQGDEPFLAPGAIEAAVRMLVGDREIGTVAEPLEEPGEWRDPGVVKVVRAENDDALYFSRAPIPHSSEGEPRFGSGRAGPLRHVGLYAFSRAALRRVAKLPRHPLEEVERLEQLRWLAAGMRIGVALVEGGASGIDTEQDLVRAEEILRRRREFP